MNDPAYKQVVYWSDPADFQDRETRYLQARRFEQRLPDDDSLRQLPDTDPDHPHHREWQMRKRSFQRLDRYLYRQFPGQLCLLDLGCGNGWMANLLAARPHRDVWAVDMNQLELEQGAQVFGRKGLQFYYADVMQNRLPEKHFQVVVLAASVQYFPDLRKLIAAFTRILAPGGEIHVVDSPFYTNDADRAAARIRTQVYFEKTGTPEMAAYYHHHCLSEIQSLGAVNLNAGLLVKCRQKLGFLPPFPWMRIRL